MLIVNHAKSGTKNALLAIASDIFTNENPLVTMILTINTNGTTGDIFKNCTIEFGDDVDGGSNPSIITSLAETTPINTSTHENSGEKRTEFQNIQFGCVFGGIMPSKNVNPEQS